MFGVYLGVGLGTYHAGSLPDQIVIYRARWSARSPIPRSCSGRSRSRCSTRSAISLGSTRTRFGAGLRLVAAGNAGPAGLVFIRVKTIDDIRAEIERASDDRAALLHRLSRGHDMCSPRAPRAPRPHRRVLGRAPRGSRARRLRRSRRVIRRTRLEDEWTVRPRPRTQPPVHRQERAPSAPPFRSRSSFNLAALLLPGHYLP